MSRPANAKRLDMSLEFGFPTDAVIRVTDHITQCLDCVERGLDYYKPGLESLAELSKAAEDSLVRYLSILPPWKYERMMRRIADRLADWVELRQANDRKIAELRAKAVMNGNGRTQ
jgi:hypothetical protein